MQNKYVRGLVTVVVGAVLLVVLLYLGDALASARSAESFGLAFQAAFGASGWVTWVIVGAVVLYIIYVLFAETEMFKIENSWLVVEHPERGLLATDTGDGSDT